jgi:sugar lactone lactonase YvrE
MNLGQKIKKIGAIIKKNIKLFCVILIAGTIFIFGLPVSGQIDENFWENQWKAFAAGTSEECQSSLKYCIDVLKVNPNHPVINYLAASLNEQLGNRDIALKYLKKAAKLGYTSSISSQRYIHQMNDPAFSYLRGKKEFQEIIEIMNISDKPIHTSQIAFIITDKRLGSYEGITYDPVEKIFYFGSDREIFKVDFSGKSTVFTWEAKEDGLNWVNGIHIDPVRRTLWACSYKENKAEIFKYDLSSGKLIKKYSEPSDGNRHFFNDLVIHPIGDIYISGTYIYRIPNNSDTVELFSKKPINSNGITLSEDGRFIYSAGSAYGICKIDIKTKAFTQLIHDDDFNTHGIDGLYCAGNNLYTVHNTLLSKVCKFRLNKDATHIESCEYFEKNTPDLKSPYKKES